MNFMFYDKLGYPYTAKFTVKSTDDDGVYSLQLNSILDADNNVVAKGDVAAGDGFTANKAGTVALSDAYKWGTGTNAGKLFAATDTTFTTPIQVGDTPADISLSDGISDDEWEFLAKAYNYSSVSEFMSTGFKVTDPGDATKTISISMTDYLTNKSIDITGGSKGAIDLVQGNTSATALTLEALNNKADSQTIVFDGSVSVTYDPATGKFTGIGGADNPSITLALSEIKAPEGGTDSNFEDIEIDFSTTTMFNNSGTSTISASSGDANKLGTGRKLGRMSGISIQDDGRIYASYDNGMSRLLGQIAVAEFANASGLEKEGDNLYKNTQNSGDFDGIGIDIKSGGGYMTTGVLEMSNVDLSAEFTDMITTQRGFQANSRIITVSDTLLEELVNLKR